MQNQLLSLSGIVVAGWYAPVQLALAVFYEQLIRPHGYSNTIWKEAQWKDIVNICWKVGKCVFNKKVIFHSFFLPQRCKSFLKTRILLSKNVDITFIWFKCSAKHLKQ